MDDRNQLSCAGSDRLAELDEPLPFALAQKDLLLRGSLPEHLVLGLEKFDVAAQFVLSTPWQKEKKRMQKPSHGDRILVQSQLPENDNLFAPQRLALIDTLPRFVDSGRQPHSIAPKR